jgi:hypothetical protein
MTITIHEQFDSREATESIESPSVDLQYQVKGTENDVDVRSVVEVTIPAFYLGLPFQSYHMKPLGGGVWDVSARYGKKEQKDTGDSSFSFDTSGGTTHTTQSLKTISKHAPPGMVAPDFKGAIGVSVDSVEGTDVTIPVYSFTETHYIASNLVTGAYKSALFFLTGRVNQAAFKGFSPGEVLFLGASGSVRGTEDWEITFRFAASPNVTGLTIGDIVGIDKEGWAYLWVRYADAEDQKVLVKQPIAVYVEKVYEYGDFSGLGIGV